MNPKAVVVAPPAISCQNPRSMMYGGIERVAWRLARVLTTLGYEVVPVASSDSDFGPGVSARGLSSEPSWCRDNRTPTVFREDAPALLDRYAGHARKVVEREQPDAVLLLGPSAQVLQAVIDAARPTIHHIVVALHNDLADNLPVASRLASEPDVKVLCLSEAQRSAFGALVDRIEVVTDGIPVAAVPFSPDPAAQRARLMRRNAFKGIRLSRDRALLGQIDCFHPNKGMLTTLEIFRSSGMSRTHDLLLAGGMGWQLPYRSRGDSSHEGEPYLSAILRFVEENDLGSSVQILGALPGWKVAELYGCMDMAISPVRLEDRRLWPEPSPVQGPEPYGQGRAMANSAGTPVLMSRKYDPAFTPETYMDLRFHDAADGADRLRRFADQRFSRPDMRSFAERRDTMARAVSYYAQFVGECSQRVRGLRPDTSEAAVESAIGDLARLENPRTHR